MQYVATITHMYIHVILNIYVMCKMHVTCKLYCNYFILYISYPKTYNLYNIINSGE